MYELSDIERHLAGIPEAEWTPVVRGYITKELYELVQALRPYVDGTMGPVSSKHVSNHLAALNLLGRLHHCFDPVAVPDADLDVEQAKRRAVLRETVRGQLRVLEGGVG